MNTAIDAAAVVMRTFSGSWGIAGGWAIDLFVGIESRPHADVDIAILRDDQAELHVLLAPARRQKVVEGALSDWPSGEVLAPPIHEAHATWPDGYHLEFLLNEQDRRTKEWVFRRDSRIRRSLAATFARRDGTPYLVPEIVLLYKAKAPLPKDDADFNRALPLLGPEQRRWLREALGLAAPGHRWAAVIERMS